MASFEVPSLSQLVLGSIALYFAYYIYWQLTIGANRRRMIRDNDCKPIKENSEYNNWTERLFGIKVFLEVFRAFKDHNLLEVNQARLRRHGSTIKVHIIGTTLYSTNEPENMKTMMATKFKDWSLPDQRKVCHVGALSSILECPLSLLRVFHDLGLTRERKC